jgi:hypothetical protein
VRMVSLVYNKIYSMFYLRKIEFFIVAFSLYLWVGRTFPRIWTMTPLKVHHCLLHVDETHCGRPLEWFQPFPQFVSITQEDELSLIKKYATIDASIGSAPECRIGVGYNVCKDINFRAVDLFTVLQADGLLKKEYSPKIHTHIDTLDKFVETFLLHFQ